MQIFMYMVEHIIYETDLNQRKFILFLVPLHGYSPGYLGTSSEQYQIIACFIHVQLFAVVIGPE